MPTSKKHIDFLNSLEGIEIEQTLRRMVADAAFNTEDSYSANVDTYPDHLIPFVDKHMNYLKSHPTTNPQHYVSNLRLMTKLR